MPSGTDPALDEHSAEIAEQEADLREENERVRALLVVLADPASTLPAESAGRTSPRVWKSPTSVQAMSFVTAAAPSPTPR